MRKENSIKKTSSIVATKTQYSNIPFNTKINASDDMEIIVVSENETKKLRRLDNNILNPKKLRTFIQKLDHNKYTVYLVSKLVYEGSWGGNILYEDDKVNKIQEKLFIRGNYSFQIVKGESFIKLLSANSDKYDLKYVVSKIRSKIDNLIKKNIYKEVSKNGLVASQEKIFDIATNSATELNEKILYDYGIELKDLNLQFEEDEEHSSNRNEYQWKELNKELK